MERKRTGYRRAALAAIQAADSPLKPSEISEIAQIPRNNMGPLMLELRNRGEVERPQPGRYSITDEGIKALGAADREALQDSINEGEEEQAPAAAALRSSQTSKAGKTNSVANRATLRELVMEVLRQDGIIRRVHLIKDWGYDRNLVDRVFKDLQEENVIIRVASGEYSNMKPQEQPEQNPEPAPQPEPIQVEYVDVPKPRPYNELADELDAAFENLNRLLREASDRGDMRVYMKDPYEDGDFPIQLRHQIFQRTHGWVTTDTKKIWKVVTKKVHKDDV